MNDSTVNHCDDQAAEAEGVSVGVGENVSTTPHDTPRTTIIGWSSQAVLIPVEHPHQGRAPSPICVASTFIDTMNQQPVAFARFSEDHPRNPYPSHNEEAPSASVIDQRSITPEAFQPPSSPYMTSGYGQSWGGNYPSDYVYANDYEYSEGILRRTTPFPAQAQEQVQIFSNDFECDSCREDIHHQQNHDSDLDVDLDCPFHDYSVKSLRGKELFIAHVPVDMSEEELKQLCSQYGDVISASIMYHDMGVSRCYAYVKFEQQSAADDALLRLNHHEVSIPSS